MSLLDNLRRLSNRIITDERHWSQKAVLFHKGKQYNINCKYNRHHTAYNEIGEIKNAVNVTIELHAYNLKSVGVDYLNANGKVNLDDARIIISDVMAMREYQINSVRPDEQLGIIVCICTLKNNNYVPV